MREGLRIGLTTIAGALAACSSRDVHDALPADAVADMGPPPPPSTLTFVFDRLEIDPSDNPDIPHSGLNLDDLFSTDIDPGAKSVVTGTESPRGGLHRFTFVDWWRANYSVPASRVAPGGP